MKYNMTKKVCYSIIIAAMAIGFTLIAIFGIDENGSGSAKDINLGLDLAGGVSITYEIQEDNPTSQDVDDTIYKLQKRVEGKSTESQVYKAGDNRITVEIPGRAPRHTQIPHQTHQVHLVYSLHLQMRVLQNLPKPLRQT